MEILFKYILPFIFAYLLGSVNLSIILSKLLIHKDIRDFGSGNAGSTNAVRVLGAKAGALVFLFDFLKCIVSMLVAKYVFYPGIPNYLFALVGLACALGHSFPIFFKFKGGKGIACGAGFLLMIDYRLFILQVSLFVIFVLITKYVSLGSIVAAGTAALTVLMFAEIRNDFAYYISIFAMVFLLVFMHRSNIKKLLNKTENKFSFKKQV